MHESFESFHCSLINYTVDFKSREGKNSVVIGLSLLHKIQVIH